MASLPPKRTFPSGEKISAMHSTTKTFAMLMKSQARWLVNQFRMALKRGSTSFCSANVKITNSKIVAAEMMKESANVIVVDVRTLEEYQQGHIENAKLLPLSELEEKASAVIPDKSKKILLYCRSGRRSAVAAELLVNSGYEKVYDFGGINDWKGKLVRE